MKCALPGSELLSPGSFQLDSQHLAVVIGGALVFAVVQHVLPVWPHTLLFYLQHICVQFIVCDGIFLGFWAWTLQAWLGCWDRS